MDENIKSVEFKVFLILWNQQQNLKTPHLHLKIADWLEARWRDGETRILLMAFRSAGKSTLVGLFAAWLLYRNPNLRILVLAADFALAKKMVRNVKRIIEHHPLTRDMKPVRADQWASDFFTVKRDLELRDPSMMARGVTSNITGSRADVVICDDVEVPNTCDSAEKREELRQRLREMAYVLVAGGSQIYVGTPHDYYSIYADVPRSEIGETEPFLMNFSRLSVPILDENGVSAWPERYDVDLIQNIKRETGPNKFESQMMLKPMNIINARLDPELLQFYNEEVCNVRELNSLFLGSLKIVYSTAWWDPAFASAKGDNSVLAIVFADEGGNSYLHHVEYIKVNVTDDTNDAMEQCKVIAALAKQFFLPVLTIENNGIGKQLPGILKNTMAAMQVPCTVNEQSSRENKATRIIEAFDGIMAAKKLYVHERICQTPFIMEMREWRPGGRGRDDGLDAVAGALSLHPSRLPRIYGKGGHTWMKGAVTQKAKTDFEV